MLAQQLVNGVLLGATYALFALGFTLMFGVLRVINLTYGFYFSAGAFIALFLARGAGFGIFPALIAGAFGAGVIAVVVDTLLLTRLRRVGAPELSSLMVTLGAVLALNAAATSIFGPDIRRLPPVLISGQAIVIGSVRITEAQLLILAATAILVSALLFLLRGTRFGLAVRAMAEQPDAAGLMGIDVARTAALVSFASGCLAGAGGVLIGLNFNAIHPYMGEAMMLRGFVVIIVGGLGDIRGALIAGLLLGVVEVMTAAYLDSNLKEAVAFAILVARAMDEAVRPVRPRPAPARLMAIPDWLDDALWTYQNLIHSLGINGLLALSMYVVLAVGQLSLGQAAFMGLGAYSSALMTLKLHWPFWAVLPAACVVPVGFALVIGGPTLRLSGVYLAIATIGLGEVLRAVYLNVDLFGGALGLSGIPDSAETWMIYALLALALVVLWLIGRSRIGRAMEAMREDEVAAQVMGVNIRAYRLGALVASAVLAGIAGALSAHVSSFIGPNEYGFEPAVTILSFALLGGIGTPLAPVLGSTILTLLPELLRGFSDLRLVFNGVIIVIAVLFLPSGLLGWRMRRRAA